MKKHLFLTGERQIGKSTAIQRFLDSPEAEDLRIGGFRSVKRMLPDGRGKVYLVSASSPSFIEENVFMELGNRRPSLPFSEGERPQRPEVRLDVFNQEGVRLLQENDGCHLILMDEIGFAESNAFQFRQEVLRVLEGDVPVLGVLRKDETDFLCQIRERPDVCVVTVTEENREWIPQLLLFGLRLPVR